MQHNQINQYPRKSLISFLAIRCREHLGIREIFHKRTRTSTNVYTVGYWKRVSPEFSLFHFFHFSLYLDGTKWVCTARDVLGTKTSGRNGKMWKGENYGATCFQQSAVTL
jgi:hypothetical protein